MTSLFGLDRAKAPSNPIGALVWGLMHELASAVGAAPKPGTPTVNDPVMSTGLVAGALGFTNPAGGLLAYTVSTGPSRGVVIVNGDGTYGYTPSLEARLAAGGTGPTTDTFTVTAFNGITSTRETVTVPISPDKPVAGTPVVDVPNTVTGAVTGQASFTDPAGQPLTYSVTTGPAKGTITEFDNTTGAFTYTPTTQAQLDAEAAGVVGADTFIVSASNGAASTPVTVAVVVDPGTPQVGAPGYNVDTSDPAGVVTGVALFTDPAGGKLIYSVTTDPTQGMITEFDTSTGAFTYVPDPDSIEVSVTFVVTATNGVHSATQTVSVPINLADPLVGNWNATSSEAVSNGASSGPQPIPDGVQIAFSFARAGNRQYTGVLTSSYGDNTASLPWATVTKTGPGTYSATLPADQLQAIEQSARDFYSGLGGTVTDFVYSLTYTVTVSEDGQAISATQSATEHFTLTYPTQDGSVDSQTLDMALTQTYNCTKIPDVVEL